MKRLVLLVLATCFPLLGTAAQRPPAVSPSKPNVLLILADDLGYSDLGCYGGEIDTPHLDRLAKNGVRFSAFYNSARCCPSRASLVTGLHPHQAGIGSFATRNPRKNSSPAYTGHLLPSCVTLAEVLGDAGYSTWMVGKWHMGIPGPIERGFQNYYGYRNFLAYAEDQWDPQHYVRLPERESHELLFAHGNFYATDAFNDYALEFLRQARIADRTSNIEDRERKPWFLYLSHSSPHFPVQAPVETIDKYVPKFRKGWDILREERFERQKKLGLVSDYAPLPPLSEVPVDRDDIANGFPGLPNPPWDSLDADRREDLARRGATYAAMVEHIDRGVGALLADLEKNGELENTLILFTSDNGACYEWGPFGFDGPSRKGLTVLHKGEDLKKIGQDGTHQSYGSGWANLGNTPLNMYKHFCHEGGIASPLIAHWPEGIARKDAWVHDPAHIMDVVPTVLEACGASYPEERDGQQITPVEGTSLLASFDGKSLPERSLAFEHQGARGLRKGDWKIVWGKRQPDEVRWELYNLNEDRSEQIDLAQTMPARTAELVAEWEAWAKRVEADPFAGKEPAAASPAAEPAAPSPQVANAGITVSAVVKTTPDTDTGVILAQGGREHGWALHLVEGKAAFDVRINGEVTRIIAKEPSHGRVRAEAALTPTAMRLRVNGEEVARKPSPGLIPVQPKDELSKGHDALTAAGNYDAPNPFRGEILETLVTTASAAPATPPRRTGPVPKPLFADPNYHGSCDPEVVWNPLANEWLVYYTARRATRREASYVGTPIGVIASRDLVNWEFRGYCSFNGLIGEPDMPDTHRAPGIIAVDGLLHMFSTYKDNAEPPWGGNGVIRHYSTPAGNPVHGWKRVKAPNFHQPDPSDVSVIKVGDRYRAYYRAGKGGGIQWAASEDLVTWTNYGKCPGDVNAPGIGYQEAPYVFEFGGWFWMLTDPHQGLSVFRSKDGAWWKAQGRILLDPGTGPQDATLARHPSVAVKDSRAFLFYHVEPNRPDPSPPAEKRTVEEKKSFLQVAELKVVDDELTCDRNAPVLVGNALNDPPDRGENKAGKVPNPAFTQAKTDRNPGPVMDPEMIRAGLKSHDRALYIKAGWIRDPYIVLGPDDHYYLTGTQPNEGDPREAEDPYNIGLGEESIVGEQVRVWRSTDLVEWESLGPVFTLDDTHHAAGGRNIRKRLIWAPEVHWMGDRWALVHCPSRNASLALSRGKTLGGPWTHPMGDRLGDRHDPSLFQDDDGTVYLLWQNTMVAPLSKDLTRYTGEPVRIDPAGSRPGPDGKPISRIGHEGATMIKVGGKYVHLGTAWSTDQGRKGSYNLYYCVADKITGPYGPRKFAGRFLGHGTPFQDRDGKWWCTAFFNANVPPLPREGIENRDLGENAQTINEQGVTIVPLDVRVLDNGEVHIRAKDPAYAAPGPDEAQKF